MECSEVGGAYWLGAIVHGKFCLESRRGRTGRVANRQGLEQAAHAARFGQAAGRLDQRGGARGRLGAGQRVGALEQAEAGEEEALWQRAVCAAPAARAAAARAAKSTCAVRSAVSGRKADRRDGRRAGPGGCGQGGVFRAVVEEQGRGRACGERVPSERARAMAASLNCGQGSPGTGGAPTPSLASQGREGVTGRLPCEALLPPLPPQGRVGVRVAAHSMKLPVLDEIAPPSVLPRRTN